MATSTKTICVVCNKEMRTYTCDGCLQRFCHKHLDEHRKNLEREFDQIETDHDELRQMINEHKQDRKEHPLIDEIDQWEISSIDKIKETANQCRKKLTDYVDSSLLDLEIELNDLARQIKERRRENEFNDLDLNNFKRKLNQLHEELLHPPNVVLNKQSTSFINFISIHTQYRKTKKIFFYILCFYKNV